MVALPGSRAVKSKNWAPSPPPMRPPPPSSSTRLPRYFTTCPSGRGSARYRFCPSAGFAGTFRVNSSPASTVTARFCVPYSSAPPEEPQPVRTRTPAAARWVSAVRMFTGARSCWM